MTDKQPTCTEKGSKHQECACGYKTVAEEIPALGHELTAHTGKPATCTEEGVIDYWSCDVCGKLFSDDAGTKEVTDTSIPMKPHTLTPHDAKDATCTEDGNIAYWSCDVCSKLFSDAAGKNEIAMADTVIGALGHKLTAHDAKAATCTTEGNIAYWSCDRCDKLFSDADGKNEVTDVTTPIIDHKFSTEWTYDETAHWHECEYGCGTKDAEASHSLTTVTDQAATCTEKGSKHQECTCGYKTAAEEISALGHKLIAHDAKAATCTEAGNNAYLQCQTCSKCYADEAGSIELFEKDIVIQALGHELTAHEAKAATCTAEGNIAYWSCDRCDKLFSDAAGKTEVTDVTTPMIDHKFSTEWTYNDTYHWHVCEYGCGTTSEKIAHSLTEVIDTQPTCTEKGSKHQECACGYKTAAEEIPALGHKLIAHDAKEATCTAKGNIAYWSCDRCGKLYSNSAGTVEITLNDTVISALGHELTAHDAKAATCTAKGNIAYWSCDRCDKLFSDADGKTEVTDVTTPMIDHKFSTEWTYNDTYHWHVCEYGCGITSEKIAHSLTEVIDKQPTCTEKGSKHQECACGYKTAAEEISAPGHKLTAHDAKVATCTAKGNIAYWSCDRCGKLFSDADGKTEITDVTTPMIEHKFSTEWTYNETSHWHECEYGCGTKDAEASHSLTTVTDKQPTCTEKGSKHQECTCGYKTAAEEIPALGHKLTAHDAKAATCTAEGNIAYWSCGRCGKLFSDADGKNEVADVTTPMIDHKFSTEWTYNASYHWHVCEYGCGTTSEKIAHSLTEVIDKQPTCTEKGSRHQECACGYKTAAEEISALGHDMEAVPAKEPTCQDSGNIAHNKCKRCNLLFDDAGKQLTEAEVTLSPDSSKHQLEEVAAQPSTCTKQGNIKHFVCKICGAKFEDETMAKPLSDEDVKRPLAKHDFSTQWCANDTYHWHACNVCGEKADIEEHTFGPWTTSASRKNDNTGKRVRYCTICNYEQVEKLDNLLSPITGDSGNIVLYTVTLASSTIALGAIAITYKKQKRKM